MSLPNLLTILRILAIPVIAYLLLIGGDMARYWAFAIYVLAAITDFFDGWLARQSNDISALGRMLDPIADKLLIAALIVVLAFDHSFTMLDLIPALAILIREVFVSGLREYLGSEGIIIHVSRLAKYKTTAQLIAIGCVILVPVLPGLNLASSGCLWVAGVLTLWTGIEYLRGAWPHLQGAVK